jgi:hypothetical protein
VCRIPVRLFHLHPVAHFGSYYRLPRCYCPFCRLSLLTGAVWVHLGAVVLERRGCQMALVLLFPTLRCLLVCTHRPFRRSLGICSMTSPLFWFCGGGVSVLSLQLESGPSFLVVSHILYGDTVVKDSWPLSVSGEALCCLHRPGEWVWWGILREVFLRLLWSAVVWEEVGHFGCVSFHPVCHDCRGLEFCLGI